MKKKRPKILTPAKIGQIDPKIVRLAIKKLKEVRLHDKRKSEFERATRLKGYSLNKEERGRYEDNWLQEAWEIFNLIDIDNIRGDT